MFKLVGGCLINAQVITGTAGVSPSWECRKVGIGRHRPVRWERRHPACRRWRSQTGEWNWI